jgi:predicted tellurium resistance membrane protein TerC
MENRTFRFAAYLVFQTLGWIVFFAGHTTIACGCLAVGNYFSCRRSYLMIGTLVAVVLLMVGMNIYWHRDYAVRMHYSIWFMLFMGVALLLGSIHEFRTWRTDSKQGHAV